MYFLKRTFLPLGLNSVVSVEFFFLMDLQNGGFVGDPVWEQRALVTFCILSGRGTLQFQGIGSQFPE